MRCKYHFKSNNDIIGWLATRQRSTCLEQKETFDTSLEVSNDNHDKSTDLNREALHDHSNGDATEMPALYLIEPLLYLIVQNYIHARWK